MAKPLTKSQIAAEIAEKHGVTKRQSVEILQTIADMAYNNAKNAAPVAMKIVVMQCPSDPPQPQANTGTFDYKGNYGLNWGRWNFIDQGGPPTNPVPFNAGEIGRVILVHEELKILAPVRAVRVAEHAQRVSGGNAIALRHQLRDFLLGGILLELGHRIENPAEQSVDNVRMILGEVGACEPDVGDQLVGRLRVDQHSVAADLR